MIIFISLLLFLSINSTVYAAPFSSTFISFSWNPASKYNLSDWQQEFVDMNKIGIKTLIIQGIATKGTMSGVNDNLTVYYESNTYLSNRAPILHLTNIMNLADQYGMKVYISPFDLASPYSSEDKKIEFRDVSKSIANEILLKYGERSSFAGWYLPVEGLLNFPTTESYITDLTKYYKTITPTKKLIVAPYFIPLCTPGRFRCDGQWWQNQTPDQIAQNAKTYIQSVGADIIAVQDGTGASEITLDELKSYLPPMAAAVTSIGKEFWVDTELFKYNSDKTQFISIDSTYLTQKIEIEKNYPLTMWILNPSMSPRGETTSKQLYDYYYNQFIAPLNRQGDYNHDGKVDLVDFSFFKIKYLAKLMTLTDFDIWKTAYLQQ